MNPGDLIHVGVDTEPDPNDPRWDRIADPLNGGGSWKDDSRVRRGLEQKLYNEVG